jgi:hypothetical protein
MTTERYEGADESVRAHLRQVSPLPAYTAAEWERLGSRIVAAAESALAARVARPSWREELANLSRVALPLALAAGIAAIVLLSRTEASASTDAAPVSAFLSAMAGETSSETVLEMTLGNSESGLLLAEGTSSQ